MKRKKFHESLRGELFASTNIEQFTGYTSEEWCEFSGLFASDIQEQVFKKNDFIFSDVYPTLKMSAQNKNARVEFTFNLESNSIRINYFIIKDRDRGIGKKAFNKFLELTSDAGFEILRCRAKGGKGITGFNGHVTWGKFGFTMDKESHILFMNKMKDVSRPETCLQKLIKDKTGCDYWTKEGNPWEAEFDLSYNSTNRRIWKIYSERLKVDQLY